MTSSEGNPRAMVPIRDMVLGTAGHIDHGKTALVRALTGVETDRLPAEKRRGITIDLGFAALDLGTTHLALVDVPGHERFIRNMLAGATGLDLALLVVAADDSVMPQTREHLEILRLLGMSGGVVALSKADLVDPSWLAMVEEDVRGLVAGTFLEGAPVVRTSAATGQGLEELRAALAAVAGEVPVREDPGAFRLAIDRAFSVAGVGTVVTGTVASGVATVGDELEWLPGGRLVRVRGIQQHDRPVERVGRGARAALNLAGVPHAEVRRGQELGAPGYLEPTRVLTVEVAGSADAARPLRHRARYRLHLGTAEVAATLTWLGSVGGDPSVSVLAQLLTAEPVVAVHGQPFILRAESPPATLGGGRILQPSARRLRRRDREAISRVELLRSTDAETRVSAALGDRGLLPWSSQALCRLAGVALSDAEALVGRLAESGELVALPLGPRRSTRVTAEFAEQLEGRVERALGRLHEARPRQTTIPRSHVMATLPDLASEALVHGLIERLHADGRVVADARSVALRGHQAKLSHTERKLKADLANRLHAGGLAPPDLADLSAGAGPRAAVVPELLELLVGEERIIAVGVGLYLDAEVEADMRRRVEVRLADGSAITVADLRDLLGITRKFAVPLAEYLDRIGLTLREGDRRRLARARSS